MEAHCRATANRRPGSANSPSTRNPSRRRTRHSRRRLRTRRHTTRPGANACAVEREPHSRAKRKPASCVKRAGVVQPGRVFRPLPWPDACSESRAPRRRRDLPSPRSRPHPRRVRARRVHRRRRRARPRALRGRRAVRGRRRGGDRLEAPLGQLPRRVHHHRGRSRRPVDPRRSAPPPRQRVRGRRPVVTDHPGLGRRVARTHRDRRERRHHLERARSTTVQH